MINVELLQLFNYETTEKSVCFMFSVYYFHFQFVLFFLFLVQAREGKLYIKYGEISLQRHAL